MQLISTEAAAVPSHNIANARSADNFSAILDSLTLGILAFEPEEFRILGYHGAAGRLKDFSQETISEETNYCRSALKTLASIGGTELSPEQDLDRRVLASSLTYLEYYYGTWHGELGNLQISGLPYDVLQLELQRFTMSNSDSASALDHFTAVEGVLQSIPAYLRQQELNLSAGLQIRAPDAVLLSALRQRIGSLSSKSGTILSGLASLAAQLTSVPITDLHRKILRQHLQRAITAYQSHEAFLAERLVPNARNTWALGRAEYRRRLALIFNYSGSLDSLVAPATRELRAIKSEMNALAHVLRPDWPTSDSLFILVLLDIRKAHASSPAELLKYYVNVQTTIDSTLTRALGLPRGAAQYFPAPAGIPVSPATNWVASLLLGGRGIVLVDVSAEGLRDNAFVDLFWIACHEGGPGHATYSVVSNGAYRAGAASLSRFLNTPDEIEYVRGDWSAMASIEGWAFLTERLLIHSGILSDEQRLAALSGQALRAARVIVDVGMHADGWSRERAVAFLTREVGLSRDAAQGQALRYSRIPVQALSYFLGASQLEALHSRFGDRLGDGFYRTVLSQGPVPPALLQRYLEEVTRSRK